jgi:hypothetical protein
MTVWQIVVSAVTLLALLVIVYRAGQNAGEMEAKARRLEGPDFDKAAKDHFHQEWTKAYARGDAWLRAYATQRSECQKLNKALIRRNRLIKALRNKPTGSTVGE